LKIVDLCTGLNERGKIVIHRANAKPEATIFRTSLDVYKLKAALNIRINDQLFNIVVKGRFNAVLDVHIH